MPEFPPLPPVAGEPISVVLLARGDQAQVEEAAGHWAAYLETLSRPHEILLADDAATDRTAVLAGSLASRSPHVRVLRDPERRGVGAALRIGIAAARHPLLFYTSCDGQYAPADLKQLLGEIDKVHLITGYRAGRPVPLGLRVIGQAYRGLARVLFGLPLEPLPGWLGWQAYAHRLLARMVFGVRLHDISCPFRLFRRAIFARIPIQSDGVFAHVEIIAKANFLGCLVSEAPVTHRPPAAGEAPGEEETTKHIRAEAYRVFCEPDFGPVQVPEEGKAALDTTSAPAVSGPDT